MQVGDKVRVINKTTIHYGKEGVIRRFYAHNMVGIYFDGETGHHLFPQEYLLPLEPKFILELTPDEWQAFKDLLKMKANLELLENLEKRVK